MVTGASEGIGREFALQLAAKGLNVLVAARNANKLEELTTEIGAFHAVLSTVPRERIELTRFDFQNRSQRFKPRPLLSTSVN